MPSMKYANAYFSVKEPVVGLRLVLLLLVVVPGIVQGQSSKPDVLTAQDLLKQVSAAYAQAGNFHVEVVEESMRTNALERDWRMTYRTVIRGTGNRFRIETRSAFGSWTQVSNGTTEWIYWLDAKRYMQHPLAGTGPYRYSLYFGGNNEVMDAWETIPHLEPLAADSVHPTRLADETISLEGQAIPCYVVHAERDAEGQSEIASDRTFWIDKRIHIFRKIVMHNAGYIRDGDVHLPFHEDITESFPVFDLDTVSPDSVFQFTPPADSKLVDDVVPDEFRLPRSRAKKAATFQPHPAPELHLSDAVGKTTTLSSYRGRPVLIDLWATWCGPCLETMPALAQITEAYRGSDLAVISIDEDDDPHAPLAYLKWHQFPWTNYHDRNDLALRAFEGKAIPLVVLLDKEGTVVFEDNTGDYEVALRAALAKLIPRPTSTH